MNAPDEQVGFRCKFPNNCDCCPQNKRAYDFIVTGLSVVERRRDELKGERDQLRMRLEMIREAAKDGASLTWIRAVADEGLRGELLT